MDHQDFGDKTLSLFKRAVETKTNIIRISITDVANIYFYSNETQSCAFQELTNKDFGEKLCAYIYQAMSDTSDTMFSPKSPQQATISKKNKLPDNVTKIDIKTYIGETSNFDMLLFFRYAWTVDSTNEQIATDLAIKAVHQLTEPLYIMNSVLDISKPETLHNFERLKALLMMAHNEGFAKGAKLGNIPS